MTTFNQKEYIKAYKKEHIKQFKVDLNITEYNELNELLKARNLQKVQFVRNAMIDLKKKTIDKQK